MQTLKHLYEAILHLARQAWLLPRTASITVRHWRRQIARNDREAERLDRIRNPSKYLGK
jgi:hypothetical protein